MERIVHFDLKGGPPKLLYFEQILHCIKSWGATGVLLEWEDTFPYSSNLSHLGSVSNAGGDELYDINAVQHIFAICRKIGLEAIQLVQTLGHLEFVLKHSCHEHLREYARSPSIICPVKQGSKELVRQMVMQVIDTQPDAKYFHIGADEVSHIGLCKDCSKRVSNNPVDHWRIYLDYIRDLVLFLREQRSNLTILMWDDILRMMEPEILQEYQLSEFVQPVVWNYDMRENFKFRPGMWDMYNKCFPAVWAGSAYKGANGSSQLISPVKRYVSNQEAWLHQMSEVQSQVQFVGVIFTGWSRYDHFATLCELLPTSLNSLANCIKCFLIGGVELPAVLYSDNTLRDGEWPGVSVARCVRAVSTLNDASHRVTCGDLRTTWLNRWQVETGYLNLLQLDSIERYVNSLLSELKSQMEVVSAELSVTCGPRTCAEWVRTYIGTIECGLADVQRTIGCARRFDPHSVVYAASSIGHAPASIVQAPATVVNAPSMAAHAPSSFDIVDNLNE